jgi:hypothetical protein
MYFFIRCEANLMKHPLHVLFFVRANKASYYSKTILSFIPENTSRDCTD